MENIIDSIVNKDFGKTEETLKEHLMKIVESKLNEKKKMCAAGMTDYPDLPKASQKLRRGLTEKEPVEEGVMKQAYMKAKKFIGHKRRISKAAEDAMNSDSWQKNLAAVTKVAKKK
jgi:hypothetical protein